MLDAYTVRKAIPRIVLAVIAINLSIYLCVAAIDITNIIGHGLGNLITGPFLDNKAYGRVQLPQNGATITAGAFGVLTLLVAGATGVFALAGSTAAAGVIATAGLALLAVLVPFVISMMLITLAVMFTLIIRQALLIFLVVVSPVAIALFVLPGTEKYFKKWLDLFAKTLLVYPIIAVIFAMSTVMAQIILGTAELSAPVMGLVKVLATVIVVFAPLVMIPFAFKFAGGAISAVMNLANGKASSISGRAGQGFQAWRKNPNSWAGKQSAAALDRRREKGFTGGQVMSGISGGLRRNGQGFKGGYKAASGAVTTEKSKLRFDEIMKHEAVQAMAGNDDFLEAGRQGKSEKEVRTILSRMGATQNEDGTWNNDGTYASSLDRSVASIMRAKGVGSQQEFERFAAVQLAGTGTGYSSGSAEMFEAINEAAGDDRVLATNMLAAARNKGQESRRYDLSSAGFGTSAKMLQGQYVAHTSPLEPLLNNDGTQIIETPQQQQARLQLRIENAKVATNMEVTDNAVLVNGAGAMLGGRGQSVKNLLPAMRRRVEKSSNILEQAIASGDQSAVIMAQREHKQNLASAAGLLDVASQVSPENAKLLANGWDEPITGKKGQTTREGGLLDMKVLGVNGRVTNVSTAFEALRLDEEFGQMRREYGSAASADANRARDPNQNPEYPVPPSAF